ncbi:MAG: N-acetyltransferase family protein [Pyrinomonadaceae bacterium]
MDRSIRIARPDDVASIQELMTEFARFVDLSEAFEVTAERLHDVLFGERSFVSALIAEVDGGPAGYAIYFPHFSSFRGQEGLFLEDLYVGEKFRGCGLGQMMLREIAREAKQKGFERIDFQVLERNLRAIEFYKALGAVSNEDERHFKFDGPAFEKLARAD